jgi:hypothetical protein
MWLATHLPYWPDLVPSHFFLFEHIKNRLRKFTFQSHDEWFAGIAAVLGQISIETLQRVFEHWIERLEWISQNNGDYDSWSKHPPIWFSAYAIRDWDTTLERNILSNKKTRNNRMFDSSSDFFLPHESRITYHSIRFILRLLHSSLSWVHPHTFSFIIHHSVRFILTLLHSSFIIHRSVRFILTLLYSSFIIQFDSFSHFVIHHSLLSSIHPHTSSLIILHSVRFILTLRYLSCIIH